MLTLSGSAPPSLSQPCHGHKKKNGLTSRLYPRASRVPNSPPKREFLVPAQVRSPHSSQNSPPICHPMYDDKHMLEVVQHATASALNNQEATATFLLLPNWMESSTSAFTKTALTTRMFAISLELSPEKVCYMPLLNQQNKTLPLPEATWGIRILVV